MNQTTENSLLQHLAGNFHETFDEISLELQKKFAVGLEDGSQDCVELSE